MENPAQKRAEAFKAIILEILAILISLILILGLLIYFKVINIQSFFPFQKEPFLQQSTPASIDVNPTNKAQTPNPSTDIFQRFFQVASNSAVTLATARVVYEGKIIELDNKGGFNQRINMDYAVMLKIKGMGEIINQVFLSNVDLQKISIVKKTGSTETPINISNLNVGDSIILDSTTDITRPVYSSIVEGKLTKL